MLDPEKLDSLCRELDTFIDEKYKIPPAEFNILVNETETLDNLNTYLESKESELQNKHMSFAEILEDMRKSLDLKKSELCKYALITDYYYNNLVTKDVNHCKPSKICLMSLGFALIYLNLEKENVLKKTPTEIMNQLLFANDIDFRERDDDLYYAILKFCLENNINEIIEIDFFLRKKGLTDLSEVLLKDISTDKKRYNQTKMIKKLVEKMNTRYSNMIENREYLDNLIKYYESKYGFTIKKNKT